MKTTYIFDTEQEGDEEKRMLFERADEMFSALWDIDQLCRSKQKYEDISDEAYKFTEEIRDLITDSKIREIS